MRHANARPRSRRDPRSARRRDCCGVTPGGRMPTEAELGRRFGVHRHTVRNAMGALSDEGLVRIGQGRGTFVQEPVLDYPVTGRTRFSDILIGACHDPHSQSAFRARGGYEEEMASALLIAAGAPVLLLEIIRYMDKVPLAVTAYYFPQNRFDGLIEAFCECASLTSALYRFGVPDYFRRGTQYARLPDEDEAHLLRQPRAPQPVLEHRSVNADLDNRPIEFAVGRYAGQRVRFVFEPHHMSMG
ncbi:MAG: phosphonate metabolism transcriptional regulator PhnF [Arhodomonas sp.]|nr:phosphonate metabolism transcriptional regulator PhnF [Arhodomonas sp.]